MQGGDGAAVRLSLGQSLGRAAGLLMKGLDRAQRQAGAVPPPPVGGGGGAGTSGDVIGAAGDVSRAAEAAAVGEALARARVDLET
ncbi:hypothetical protein MNEG_12289, partial [Monoraphidium neglectum]